MAQIENVKSCTIVKETKNYTVQKIIKILKILKIIFKHKKRHALQAHGNKSRDGHGALQARHAFSFSFLSTTACKQSIESPFIYPQKNKLVVVRKKKKKRREINLLQIIKEELSIKHTSVRAFTPVLPNSTSRLGSSESCKRISIISLAT